MAVYKVPQDVEAEDKFFGPFSFKQFIFFGGVAVCGYLVFLTATKGIWPLSIIFFFPMAIFGFLAFPWSKEQPTELWLAAHIRFLFMKRKRIWDQTGMKDLVTVTAPKREVHALTDGLSQNEVRDRFNALASVVDSRGWAVKNLTGASDPDSDRLADAIDSSSTFYDDSIVEKEQDVLDVKTNPLAKQFDTLIDQSESKHKQEMLELVKKAKQTQQPTGPALPQVGGQKKQKSVDYSFLDQQPQPTEPGLASFKSHNVVQPGSHTKAPKPVVGMGVPVSGINKDDEQKLLEKVHKQQKQEDQIKRSSHLKTILPAAQQQAQQQAAQAQDDDDTDNVPDNAQASSPTPVDPAIIDLSNNDDLSVETLARQAKKDMPDSGEVVISLR